MNYKVLYRKYRPDNFENIIGQDYIIKTLKNSIINKNIAHAYIFSGPRGTGKTSTAKVFAKAINCLNNDNGTPCGNCEFCRNFVENPDIIEIDAASNNGVDEIRGLIDNIKLTPTNGEYKVYIIDEVHMLTTSAFNALLLTLEEPPKHAIFIFATTNIENVPITILSRCQRFDFQKIKIDDINSRLKFICEKENIDIDEEALTEISYLAEGGLRDALSLLDQLSKSNQKITLDLVESNIRIISAKTLNELLDNIENNNIDDFLDLIKDFRNRAVDYKNLLKKLIDAASIRAKNIKITGKCKRLTFDNYKKMVLILTELITKININVDPYTIIEVELLDFFNIKMVENVQNNQINESVIIENNVNNNTEDIDNLIKIRINNCFVDAKKNYLEEIKLIIKNYLNSSSINGKNKSILLDSSVVASSSDYAIITCDSIHIMENANKLLDSFEKELFKICDKKVKLIFITNEMWEVEKKKYIENLKNNITYQYMEEKSDKIEENDIVDIFDKSKIEII